MRKRILSLFVVLAMVLPMTAGLGAVTASADTASTVVRLDPSDASPFNNGEFQGWGTSMGWWGNRIGYSDEMAKQAAELFYSEDGLGLDIVRYNIGGGDRPEHIETPHVTRSDSKMPCFANPTLDENNKPVKDSNGKYTYTYNWNADYNQVNVLKEIKKQNDNVHIEGYTNSPPWFMTESLCSGGGIDGAENLAVENYDDFAEFIGDVTEHFEIEGLRFDSYSPMNEPKPETKYWVALNDKQEGNLVAQGEHQSGLILAVSNEFKKRGIDTIVAGMDETDINYSISAYNSLSDDAKQALGRLDTHTYGHKNGGFNRAGLKETAKSANKNLWMSEVDGGWNGFDLAQRIIDDMNGMMPSAWVMWDIIDSHKDSTFTYPAKTSDPKKDESGNTLNVTGSMWGVGMADHDAEEILLANKYYAYGQFTKYINPGDTIIASSSNTLAAYNKNSGEIKIVALNAGAEDLRYKFDLSAFLSVGNTVEEIRTNNLTGDNAEHWKEITGEAILAGKQIDTTLKAGTVTTYVVKGNRLKPELEFNAATGEYSYDVPQALSGADIYVAVYDGNGVLHAVRKNKPADKIDGTSEGYSAKLFVWNSMQPVDNIRYMMIKGPDSTIKSLSYIYTAMPNEEYQYTVEMGEADIDTPITWSVSDETIATVDNNGKLTTIKGGVVTLTAEAEEIGLSTSVDIKVMDSGQLFRIVNKKSGKGLETKSKSVASGATIVQYEDRLLDTGAWRLEDAGDGCYNIINANADMLLANVGGLVITDTLEKTNDNAKWALIKHGDYYEIKNIGAGKSLDVSGEKVDNNINVLLYNFGNKDNELWYMSEITDELTHVGVTGYDTKYEGTDYSFVSNVAAATNDFESGQLNGISTSGTAKLTEDAAGENVLGVQANFSNEDGKAESGTASLEFSPAISCENGQTINIAFDLYCSNSGNTAGFTVYGDNDETQLVDMVVSAWDHFDIKVGSTSAHETDGAKYYLRNGVNDKKNDQLIANGGHFEIYYTPSTGAIKVTLKNNTNNRTMKVYEGTLADNTSIAKITFNANYTTWSKPMYLDNLVTNIITEKAN